MKATKLDWINGALEALSDGGVHAVQVESLARKLGVTKGGFYGYFLNRDAFLQEVLAYWETILTDETISLAHMEQGDLHERLTHLLQIVYIRLDEHVDDAIDNAMTSWSFKDQRVRVVVNRVVRKRIDFIKNIFLEEGFSEEQAELRARLVHSFVHGDRHYPDTCEALGSAEREKMAQALIDYVCKPQK